MKKYLKTSIVLMAICAVAALLLALFNSFTLPRITAYENQKATQALTEVSNGIKLGDHVEVDDEPYVSGYYKCADSSGYVLDLRTNGYGGTILLMASYSNDGKVRAAKVLSSSETPGLGKKSENPGYMDKFVGKGSDMPTKKTMLTDDQAQEVSGASMTFTGISKALLAGSIFVNGLERGNN